LYVGDEVCSRNASHLILATSINKINTCNRDFASCELHGQRSLRSTDVRRAIYKNTKQQARRMTAKPRNQDFRD
jgi:hypothetical protein